MGSSFEEATETTTERGDAAAEAIDEMDWLTGQSETVVDRVEALDTLEVGGR